jgi:hypothetical protein
VGVADALFNLEVEGGRPASEASDSVVENDELTLNGPGCDMSTSEVSNVMLIDVGCVILMIPFS